MTCRRWPGSITEAFEDEEGDLAKHNNGGSILNPSSQYGRKALRHGTSRSRLANMSSFWQQNFDQMHECITGERKDRTQVYPCVATSVHMWSMHRNTPTCIILWTRLYSKCQLTVSIEMPVEIVVQDWRCGDVSEGYVDISCGPMSLYCLQCRVDLFFWL